MVQMPAVRLIYNSRNYKETNYPTCFPLTPRIYNSRNYKETNYQRNLKNLTVSSTTVEIIRKPIIHLARYCRNQIYNSRNYKETNYHKVKATPHN